MENQKEKIPTRNFNLTSFKKATKEMINLNNSTYLEYLLDRRKKIYLKDYKPEEIQRIINSGSSDEQQKLSRNYFYKDGFYKKIILFYASLLKNAGLLIPTPRFKTNLSKDKLKKAFYKGLDFVEDLSIPTLAPDIYTSVLRDGAFYAVKQYDDKKNFFLLQLPSLYCSSKYKNLQGKDVIDFDLTYFDSIADKKVKNELLTKAYPKIFLKAYNQYKKGIITNLFSIPTDISLYLSITDDSRPFFLSIIQATIDYDEAVQNHKEKDLEEIKKIIVNEIPHLNDGQLLFEPEEAAEMHEGICDMVGGNPNLSVITSYGNISSIGSNTTDGVHKNYLEPMIDNIYVRAGVSKQLFASSGTSTLEKSIENDISFMMLIANKLAKFVTDTVNDYFGSKELTFKYMFLPVSYYNEEKYITSAYKLVNSGYSYLVPALAQGFSQKDFLGVKQLENDVMDLEKLMIPLQSAFQTNGKDIEEKKSGGQEKPAEELTPKTIQNKESIEKQGE